MMATGTADTKNKSQGDKEGQNNERNDRQRSKRSIRRRKTES